MNGVLQGFRVKPAKKCIGNGGMDCICVNSPNGSGLSYACTRTTVQASKTFAIRLRREFTLEVYAQTNAVVCIFKR